jgi:hypothetical protein
VYTTVNYSTSHFKGELGGEFSTHGLGDIICNTVRHHSEPFCAGKCAVKRATHRVQSVGKARLITNMEDSDRCPECWGSVFWSNKYAKLRVPGEE